MIKKIISKIQNLIYYARSKIFKRNQNKIFMIGSYPKLSSIIKELKKNKNNIIIRGSTSVGRSLFRKDVDYFITFNKNSDDYIKKTIKDFNIIVVTNDYLSFEKKVITIANKLGIPSLVVQHGALVEDAMFKKLIVTKMSVWGESTKEWAINLGEDKDKLIITGAPHFDKYIKNKPKEKRGVLNKLKIPLSKKILLYTTQPIIHDVKIPHSHITLKDHKDILYTLCRAAKELDLFLIIKLHPSNELSNKELHNLIPRIGFKNYLFVEHGKANLIDLINICDIFVTYMSTTAIEAMIFKKPIITINFLNKFDPVNYSKHGCSIQANTKEELDKAVLDILNNKKTRDKLEVMSSKFLKNYCYKLDGLSSRRTANLIIDMAKGKLR